MRITLITRACGFGLTRAGTEFTSNSPAAGKTVLTRRVVRALVDPVVVGGCAPSAKEGAATIAASRAASPSSRASLIRWRRRRGSQIGLRAEIGRAHV